MKVLLACVARAVASVRGQLRSWQGASMKDYRSAFEDSKRGPGRNGSEEARPPDLRRSALIPFVALAALISPSSEMLGPLGSPTNSDASSRRGTEAFGGGEFAEAAAEFGEARRYREVPETSFNFATALIASGDVKNGLEVLGGAVDSEQLLTDVRYNAGWAALDIGDLDNAILAYEEVLKDRPADQNAKRNLEIALKRKEQKDDEQQSPQPQPPDPGEGEQQPDPQDVDEQGDSSDIDSVLRSVEQQEKEELDRMRRSRQRRKLNW